MARLRIETVKIVHRSSFFVARAYGGPTDARPAVLLTHSQAGLFGWLIADARPSLVGGIVVLEPAGPPKEDAVPKTGAERNRLTRLVGEDEGDRGHVATSATGIVW